jgi:hypothetical protein
VRYTIWSRGRLIGETDLAFFRVISRCRFGSFHPNAEGERLMPVVASVLPALRAYLHRDAADALSDSIVQPPLRGSTLFADLAEAWQHLHALDLELRREDGSVVPTSHIGIRDTQQLIELADLDDDGIDVGNWDADDDLFAGNWNADDDLFEAAERDLQGEADDTPDTGMAEEELRARVDDPFAEWTTDDLEEPQVPRYQIHVELLHDDAIP